MLVWVLGLSTRWVLMSGVEAAHRDDGKSLQNINFHIVLVFMARAFLFFALRV